MEKYEQPEENCADPAIMPHLVKDITSATFPFLSYTKLSLSTGPFPWVHKHAIVSPKS